eukprot:TRINITY_DN174_c0_g1_i4.p1 TRINITY_DN174_c0_g1~~TRINITY_DN174_c0_g1_i4.p1  ORF type:complete len:539 (-),score=167.53 TRINITY_DN174_c0_g1_i4:603-2219(-)
MAASAPQFASLYVGDLHVDVTEAMLYEIFNAVGPVASIRVCRDSITRKSLGYAYVNFHQVADAERALDTLNYSSIKGRACRIMWSQRDPSLRKNHVGNVFVRNLDKNIDNKALYDTFSLFGNILSCKVATNHKGESNGYGFVHYETEDAAKQAIERVNGMQIGDNTVQVCMFVKNSEREGATIFTNLYVKHMPADWDEAKVTEVFGKFGTITSSCMQKDPKGRSFAFVNFEEPDAAKKALEELNGKDVRSEEQKKKDEEDENADKESFLLYVSKAQSKSERMKQLKKESTSSGKGAAPQGVNLYVKNLDENTDDTSLKELFAPYGTITSVKAMLDDSNKCKGFGFVCFAAPDEATKAVTEMHLKVVQGKPLYVGLAEKKDQRTERLKNRYTTGGMGAGGMGGNPMMMGGKGDKGKGKMGGGMCGPQMMQGKGGMPGMGPMGPMGGMMGMPPQMMGKGMPGAGMMNPQQMAMMGKGGPGMMGMPGKGPGGMPMMGGPQMMAAILAQATAQSSSLARTLALCRSKQTHFFSPCSTPARRS